MFGSTVGRFNVDLYESEGSGDRSTSQISICDKTNGWRSRVDPIRSPSIRMKSSGVGSFFVPHLCVRRKWRLGTGTEISKDSVSVVNEICTRAGKMLREDI